MLGTSAYQYLSEKILNKKNLALVGNLDNIHPKHNAK